MNTIAKHISEKFPNAIYVNSHNQDVFYLLNDDYKNAVAELKNSCEVTMCLDVTAVDFLSAASRNLPQNVQAQRFEVVSNFISHSRNERVRFIVQVSDHDTHIDSITDIFPGANFGEREVYDMFGITFDSHPDMTRILMPDEWEGYPLRKDDSPSRIPVNFTDDLTSVKISQNKAGA